MFPGYLLGTGMPPTTRSISDPKTDMTFDAHLAPGGEIVNQNPTYTGLEISLFTKAKAKHLKELPNVLSHQPRNSFISTITYI